MLPLIATFITGVKKLEADYVESKSVFTIFQHCEGRIAQEIYFYFVAEYLELLLQDGLQVRLQQIGINTVLANK
jgi:hypothetical protein